MTPGQGALLTWPAEQRPIAAEREGGKVDEGFAAVADLRDEALALNVEGGVVVDLRK